MKKRSLCIPALLAAAGITLMSGCSSSSAPQSEAQLYNYNSSNTVLLKDDLARSGSSGHAAYDTAEAVPEYENAGTTQEYEYAAVSGAESQSLTSVAPIQPVATARKLIRRVNLTAETTTFDQLITEVNQTVTDLGGYLEQSDVSGNSLYDSYSRNRYAYLLIRVPADKLDSFITQVGNRANITNTNESTEDVTLQYSDLESRKKSLTIEQERLWGLLEKADTMEGIIALEARLSEIRYELESFESQLRIYDNQVDYSTITLNINEVPVLTPTAPDSVLIRIQKGFTRNLGGVSDGLVNFFVWLISSLPTLLLLAVILVIIILILRKIKKRTVKLQQSKIAAATADTPDSQSARDNDTIHSEDSK